MVNLMIKRLYYTIRDIRELVQIPSHTLREWESKYTKLKPAKSKSGRRLYRKRDLVMIMKIKELKQAGYQDEKIQEILENPIRNNLPVAEIGIHVEDKKRDLIDEITQDLNEIIEILDKP